MKKHLEDADAREVLARIHAANLRHPATHVGTAWYCGRANASHGLRESALHNMHNVGRCRSCGADHGTGGQTLPLFEPQFRALVAARQPAVMAELRGIWRIAARGGHVTLLCWCKPNPCHTDVLRNVLFDLATGRA